MTVYNCNIWSECKKYRKVLILINWEVYVGLEKMHEKSVGAAGNRTTGLWVAGPVC